MVSEASGSLLVATISLFSGSFNFTCIGYALLSMSKVNSSEGSWAPAVNSAALWGAVTGMCVLGYIGDHIGRKRAMVLTLCLVVFGAVASSVATWGDEKTLMQLLVAFRFVLGVGVGGIFPLSAVSARESGHGDTGAKSRRVSLVWMAMPLADVATPLAVCLLLYLFPEASVAWRAILGFGALPAAFVLWRSTQVEETEEFRALQDKEPRGMHVLVGALKQRGLLSKLVGTAGSWLLFDFAWYGLAICMPTLTQEVFGTNDHMRIAMLNAAISSTSLPGNLVAIWLVSDKRLGRRRLQMCSFCFMSITFASLATAMWLHASRLTITLLYVATVFSTNNGPGLTTYSLPQEIFPAEVRTTLNGISAAAGKIGGALGATLFRPIAKQHGLHATMFVAAACQLVAMAITFFFIPQKPSHVDSKGPSLDTATLADPLLQEHPEGPNGIN